MTPDMPKPRYADMVAEADSAVSSVKDPALRAIAFEKILANLLDGGTSLARSPSPAARDRTKRVSRSTSEANPKRRRSGPKAYVESLIDDGFFKEPRTIAQVKAQLANAGHHVVLTSLSGPLQTLTQERRLRRQKMAGDGKQASFSYSNA